MMLLQVVRLMPNLVLYSLRQKCTQLQIFLKDKTNKTGESAVLLFKRLCLLGLHMCCTSRTCYGRFCEMMLPWNRIKWCHMGKHRIWVFTARYACFADTLNRALNGCFTGSVIEAPCSSVSAAACLTKVTPLLSENSIPPQGT